MNEKLSETLKEKWLEKLKNRYLLSNSEKDLRAYEHAKYLYVAKSKGRSDYERGMNDIWEALDKFLLTPYTDREFYYNLANDITIIEVLQNLTPQEFMAKHEAAMRKLEDLKIRRGDKVKCVGRCEEVFDAIYLGEDERFHHILTRDGLPQALSKSYSWTLIKYEGQHVDLDSLFD